MSRTQFAPATDEHVNTWADARGQWHADVHTTSPHRARPLATAAILDAIDQRQREAAPAWVIGINQEASSGRAPYRFGETHRPEIAECGLDWEDLIEGFLETLLWTGHVLAEDQEPDMMDEHLDTYRDLPNNVLCEAAATLGDFTTLVVTHHRAALAQFLQERNSFAFGHNFALTRAGHGAGFWDREMGKAGDVLTSDARSFAGDGLTGSLDSQGNLTVDFS